MNNYEVALFKDKKLGFFLYLSVEAVMFITLFATYVVYTPSTSGPHPSDVFGATNLIISSFFLLSSSGTMVFSEKGLGNSDKKKLLIGLGITLLFACIFLGLTINEFYGYVQDGYGISVNTFMGAFYVLVGLHAAHVAFGIGWMVILFMQFKRGIPYSLYMEKHRIFSYYWHFVDIIWVFIIIIVYVPFLI